MTADELIQKIEELKVKHGNCEILIDSEYVDEASVEAVEVLSYPEKTYFVVKS